MDIAAKIVQRRKQILIHSIIYYRFGDSIISDQQWNEWAYELFNLQKEYPDISASCFMHEEFKDFDPCSGYYLPLDTPWAIEKARWLVDYYKKGE